MDIPTLEVTQATPGKAVIARAALPALTPSMAGSLACSHEYVEARTRVRDLREAWAERPELAALGVTDDRGQAVGLLTRSHFQGLLSRPFALEVLDKRSVAEMALEVRSFGADRNILTIAEKLDDLPRLDLDEFFLLHGPERTFTGVLAVRDLVVHLYQTGRKDLRLGQSLQKAIVPERRLWGDSRVRGLGASHAAKGVGGDFYGVREYSPGRWAGALCDVSGKGLAASLVTTALAGMFSLYDFSEGLGAFVRHLNTFLLDSFRMEKYLTGLFWDYEPASGNFQFYDMGHSYLYLIRRGQFWRSQSPNPFLGFVPDLNPRGQRFSVQPGDWVVAFTDGIPEQSNTAGEEFGLGRFESLLSQNRHRPLDEVWDQIEAELKAFRGDQPRRDDITLLTFRS